MTEIAPIAEGETVFVSAAAGAVGSVAGQIAKARGCRVIGSAGAPEKVAYVRDVLGFDAAFSHRDDVRAALAEAAPDGVDVYFDNVGGPQLEAAIGALNRGGRIALCGAVSQYNATEPAPGPRNLGLLVGKRGRMRGFIVSDHAASHGAFLEEVGGLLADGRLVLAESVVDGGIEAAPRRVRRDAPGRAPRQGRRAALMPKRSAGILLHRRGEVLLVHPGGPFWAKRDDGAWSIPKGEYEDGEDPLAAARREFEEELGSALPDDARAAPARRGQAEERQGRGVLGGRGRPRRDGGALEHVRDGVAAPVGPAAGVPRDRSCRVVPARPRAREARAGAGGVRGPAGSGVVEASIRPSSALLNCR